MDKDLEQMTPNQRRALRKGLVALETMASLWGVEIRLREMAARISAVDSLDERASRIAAVMELAFVEGAYRHYLNHQYVGVGEPDGEPTRGWTFTTDQAEELAKLSPPTYQRVIELIVAARAASSAAQKNQ